MSFHEYEIALLALCIWREAAIDGEAGMRAVAHVILNRVNDVEFPNSFWSVICQRNQFSSMTLKGDLMTVRYPAGDDESFAKALQIAEQVYNLDGEDPTGKAIYYRNPDTATSKWYEENVVDNPGMVESARIGHHVFHRRRVGVPSNPELWGEA